MPDLETENSSETENKRSSKLTTYLSLYLSRFALGLGASMLLTFIPIYTDILDATPFWIGMFTTGYAASGLVTILPLGWISDRYSKKLVLLWGTIASLLSYILFMFVIDEYSLTAARILQGIAVTAGGMTGLALIGELVPHQQRGRLIGIYNAIRNLSSAVGSVVGGWLYIQFGFSVPYLLLIVLTAASVLLIYYRLPPDETSIAGFTYGLVLSNKRIQAMASFRVFYSFAVMMVRTYIPIYAGVTLGFNPVQVGSIIASEKVLNMALQPFTGHLSDRFGRFPLVLIGGVLYASGAFVIAFQSSFYLLFMLNAFLGLADSLREPASMALFAEEGQGSGIASAFSIRGILWRPGMVLAPMIGSYLMSTLTIQHVFLGAVFFTIIAICGLPIVLWLQGSLSRGELIPQIRD